MLPFADDGDQVCKEAMFENLAVIGRMNERIGLLRAEVEKRGFLWGDDAEMVDGAKEDGLVNGDAEMVNETRERQQSGRLTDEELRRRLEAQMGEDEDDGVHL